MAAEPRAKKVPRPGTRILPVMRLQGAARLVPSGHSLILAKQYMEGKFDARKVVWELGKLVLRVFSFSNMGTRLGELLLPLVHCVLTKSLPLITARIQKSDWVRVWPVRGTTYDPTAVFSIAPATVTRLRKYHNGPGKR